MSKQTLPRNPVEVYYNISKTQLSVARYYRGVKIDGSEYYYFSIIDALVRIDLKIPLAKHLKQGGKFDDFFAQRQIDQNNPSSSQAGGREFESRFPLNDYQ